MASIPAGTFNNFTFDQFEFLYVSVKFILNMVYIRPHSYFVPSLEKDYIFWWLKWIGVGVHVHVHALPLCCWKMQTSPGDGALCGKPYYRESLLDNTDIVVEIFFSLKKRIPSGVIADQGEQRQ